MNFKKLLSTVVAVAMAITVVAAMASVVGAASAYDPITYDRKIGGWIVNDFRRNEGEGFNNMVGINPYDQLEENLVVGESDMNLLLPPGVDYSSIGGAKISFDFGLTEEEIEAGKLAELPKMAVIFSRSGGSWEQHDFHVDPEVNTPCADMAKTAYTAMCEGKCAYDENLNVTIPFVAPGVPFGKPALDINEYLKITVTCDWASETRTPGSAKVQLLDKEGNVIPLYLFCKEATCNGPCVCPCPGGCGVIGVGCECPCDVCGKYPCECYCEVCGNEPCSLEGPCEPIVITTPPPTSAPPPETTTIGSVTTVTTDTATASATTTTTAKPVDSNPKTGVVFAIIPVLIAAGTVAVSGSKKSK